MPTTVSARELKQHLGRYLEAASRGETVAITRRGKVVAELSMPALTGREKLERLARQGRVRLGNGRKLGPASPQPAGRSIAEILESDRDNEPL